MKNFNPDGGASIVKNDSGNVTKPPGFTENRKRFYVALAERFSGAPVTLSAAVSVIKKSEVTPLASAPSDSVNCVRRVQSRPARGVALVDAKEASENRVWRHSTKTESLTIDADKPFVPSNISEIHNENGRSWRC